jgi:hypothetical protein
MAFASLRPADSLRPKLHAQPVHQPRQVTVAARLLDQAFLRRSKRFRPVGCKRERIEAEAWIERRHLVGEKPLQMRRLAACDCGCDPRDRRAAVDFEAGEAEAARAKPPLLELADQLRHQPLQRLARRFRIGRRLFQPKHGSRRRLVALGGHRLGLPAKRPVERIDDIVRAPEPPRQRQPRQAGKGPDRLQPKPLESPRRLGFEPERRYVKRRKLCQYVPLPNPSPAKGRGAESRQCPSGRRGRSDRHPGRQSHGGKTPAHILGQRLLTAEQMRDSADVEPQRTCPERSRGVAAIHLDQRRPSKSPARQPPEKRFVASPIGRERRSVRDRAPGHRSAREPGLAPRPAAAFVTA